MANKSGLKEILQQVLSVGNAEQNFAYPPSVYSQHYNITTSFLLDKFSLTYPTFVDCLLPFIEVKKIPITNGYVQLPETYRNLLGAPSISVKSDGSDCLGDDPVIIDTASEFKTANLKSGCKTVPIEILDKKEWDYRTTSTYAFPTLENPIGLYIGGRRIKVCPYDLMRVEVMYIKKEPIGVYGYVSQPDDTFIFDEDTSTEVGWTEAASEFLFRGVLALYGAYSRDKDISDFNLILKQASLI